MPRRTRVEYVIAQPTPPTWWKKNRHLVLLVVGLLIGAWLVNGQGSATDTPHDRPKPAHSTASAQDGEER